MHLDGCVLANNSLCGCLKESLTDEGFSIVFNPEIGRTGGGFCYLIATKSTNFS